MTYNDFNLFNFNVLTTGSPLCRYVLDIGIISSDDVGRAALPQST